MKYNNIDNLKICSETFNHNQIQIVCPFPSSFQAVKHLLFAFKFSVLSL